MICFFYEIHMYTMCVNPSATKECKNVKYVIFPHIHNNLITHCRLYSKIDRFNLSNYWWYNIRQLVSQF